MKCTRRACCGPTIQSQFYPVQAAVWLHLTGVVCSSLTIPEDYSGSWWLSGSSWTEAAIPGNLQLVGAFFVHSKAATEALTKRILKIQSPTLYFLLPEVVCSDIFLPCLNLSSTSLPLNMRSPAHSCLRMRVKRRTKANIVE